MTGRSWSRWVEGELAEVRAAGRWRQVRAFDATGPAGELEGRAVVSFASNDYLGLTTHPRVRAGAAAALERWGTGSGASRLVVGSRPVHHELEDELAAWRGTEAALTFPTGFAANLGVLAALGGPGVTIFSDELNHASIIDGCRLSRSRVQRYRHADLDHLDELLAAHDHRSAPGDRALVVTDTVFSMDGDEAPLAGLVDRCARHRALLVLDEAHAVLGPALPPVPDEVVVVRVGTLSKALGSLGGFVAGSRAVVDLLVNRARPFIFTTALSPADAGAALAAVRLCRGEEGARLRARLRDHVERVRPGGASPIVPIVLGSEEAALAASAQLLEAGLHVPAIRPPTVPVGTSRLRVALSAAHAPEQVAALVAALDGLDGLDGLEVADGAVPGSATEVAHGAVPGSATEVADVAP